MPRKAQRVATGLQCWSSAVPTVATISDLPARCLCRPNLCLLSGMVIALNHSIRKSLTRLPEPTGSHSVAQASAAHPSRMCNNNGFCSHSFCIPVYIFKFLSIIFSFVLCFYFATPPLVHMMALGREGEYYSSAQLLVAALESQPHAHVYRTKQLA